MIGSWLPLGDDFHDRTLVQKTALLYQKFEDIVRQCWKELSEQFDFKMFTIHDGFVSDKFIDPELINKFVFEKTGMSVGMELDVVM